MVPLTVPDTFRRNLTRVCLFVWKGQGKSDLFGLERLNLKSLGCLCKKYWLAIRKCRSWSNEEISELELHICRLSTIRRDNNWNHVRGWDHHGKEYIETRICGNKLSDQVTTQKADRTSHIIWHNFFSPENYTKRGREKLNSKEKSTYKVFDAKLLESSKAQRKDSEGADSAQSQNSDSGSRQHCCWSQKELASFMNSKT